jgi:hypothetical protein
MNRRNTIGAIYNFIHYDYPKAFGEANIHVAMGFWQYDINKFWNFEVQAGAFVADSAGTESVPAAPIVQQLLGVTSITEAFSRVVTLPNAQLRLTGRTGNSSLTLSAYRGAGAGNGVTLASSQQSAALLYSYVFSKRLTFGLSATYSGAVGLSDSADRFSILYGGFNVEYHANRSFVYTLRGQYRKAEINGVIADFVKNAFQIGLGVGWNMRDIPFLH